MIEIEKGIPVPKEIYGRRRKYPWREMSIGDSFVVELRRSSVHCAISGANRRTGMRFIARKTDDGRYRIWRVE